MRHTSNLTPYETVAEVLYDKGRRVLRQRCVNHKNATPAPVIAASSYVRVNNKERVAALTMGGHDSLVCADLMKGATWVAGLNGPLWTT
jgi:hypothetical protein